MQIYNLCIEETYDPLHFYGRVETYPFDDNHVPPLQMVKQFCESVHTWLSRDPKNVAVVHCMVLLTVISRHAKPMPTILGKLPRCSM